VNESQFEAAGRALATARSQARAIETWPREQLPGDLAEAYRLQSAVLRELGPIGGWKIAAVTPAQREALAVELPIGAGIPARRMHDAQSAPARLRSADFIAPKLECEIAFALGRDLPARPGRPYSRDEVRSATRAMHLAVEIVDSRLPRGLGALAELADGFNTGALVVGAGHGDWEGVDFASLQIVLVRLDAGASGEVARGSARTILDGDPFGTVVLLANAPADAARGLVAGDVITTGSCTGAPALPGPGHYRATFAGIGSVEFVVEG
jgi:2-keto-4-pentenoate hydratase